MNVSRSFTSGTAIGNKLLAAGGFDGTSSVSIAETLDACVPTTCGFQVLIVYSDSGGQPSPLQSQILAEPGVASVDLFQATTRTPTLAQFQLYDIVVPFSNNPFADPDTLGNNLADYVAGGGIVVQLAFSHTGPGEPNGINGRWVSGNYNPYSYSTNFVFDVPFTLGTFNAGHPLMAGVTELTSNFQNVVTLAPGATEVAAASNGNSLVAYRPVNGGRTTVGITAFLGIFANQSGHWGRVIVNAGNWLGNNGCGPTPTPTSTATPTGLDFHTKWNTHSDTASEAYSTAASHAAAATRGIGVAGPFAKLFGANLNQSAHRRFCHRSAVPQPCDVTITVRRKSASEAKQTVDISRWP